MGFDPISLAVEAGAALTSIIGGTGGVAGLAMGGAAGAATATPWMATAGLGASLLGGVTGAYGAYSSGQAQAKAAKYNAAVSRNNAQTANENATITGQAGEAQAGIQQQKTRAVVGQLKADQAASGLDVNSGSAVDVRSSAQELGELDALTIRSNATKEAYGYRTQSENFKAQGALDEFETSADEEAGDISAGGTFLGSVGSSALNYANYKRAGGFNT